MYTLTLTYEERKAIDWVGYRDWNGDDLSDFLLEPVDNQWVLDEDAWNQPRDIEFKIPEATAWEIHQLYTDGDEIIPHFAPELASKIQTFLDSII